MLVVVGVEVGSALVPPSGLGSALSLSALCSHSPTIIRITTRTATTATTHWPQLTTHRRRIIPQHGAVGAPLMDTITPVEQRALAPEPWQRYTGLYSRKLSVFNPNRLPLLRRFGEPNERRLLPLAQVAPADLDIPILSQLPPSQFSLGDALEPRPLKVVRLNATRGVPVAFSGKVKNMLAPMVCG